MAEVAKITLLNQNIYVIIRPAVLRGAGLSFADWKIELLWTARDTLSIRLTVIVIGKGSNT